MHSQTPRDGNMDRSAAKTMGDYISCLRGAPQSNDYNPDGLGVDSENSSGKKIDCQLGLTERSR